MERDSSVLMNALQERLLGELKSYADGRKARVLRNAETEALAGLLLEKFGYGPGDRCANCRGASRPACS